MTQNIIPKAGERKITPEEAQSRARMEALSTTPFPMESFPEGFKEAVQKALKWNSILRLQCHDSTWSNMIFWNRPFIMPEVDLMCGVLRAATPIEMEQTLEENWEMISSLVHPTMLEWARLDKEITDPITERINAQILLDSKNPKEKQRLILPANGIVQKHILPNR